ncbi:MAG: YbaB/EbfC family nucleoid-associated protein [Christensenellaceae bacterium]|jgi:DNA-binding YbaB/EbfC family protein|nr:YbaB/EbfC family nucleoid-associated protein [Christensenellaceae bacterium]
MGKFSGFGGGPGNFGGMQNLLKQAQKMQEEMNKAKEDLANEEVTASAGGNSVKVTMTCDYKISSIKLQPEAINPENPGAVDPDDIEMLEDLLTAALNDALNAIEEKREDSLGTSLPAGGFPGLF